MANGTPLFRSCLFAADCQMKRSTADSSKIRTKTGYAVVSCFVVNVVFYP